MHGVKPAALVLLGLLVPGLWSCNEDVAPIRFGAMAALSGDAGRGGFRFGVATAATQIEDMNPHTDWYLWTQPVAAGGLGHGTFVGDATRGYSKALDDVGLVAALGVDSYRFSIEWARIEPARNHPRHAAPLLQPGLDRRSAGPVVRPRHERHQPVRPRLARWRGRDRRDGRARRAGRPPVRRPRR
ncbi:MAG: glycosyl hydrolase family protein [Deltaproteobacteria bacterium]|nr:MAG: glycosyl hydrolase family protein [Deltaproteobacteria bacterium]